MRNYEFVIRNYWYNVGRGLAPAVTLYLFKIDNIE